MGEAVTKCTTCVSEVSKAQRQQQQRLQSQSCSRRERQRQQAAAAATDKQRAGRARVRTMTLFRASCTARSDCASSAEVASSSSRICCGQARAGFAASEAHCLGAEPESLNRKALRAVPTTAHLRASTRLGVAQERARDGDALPLPAAELPAALPHVRLVPAGGHRDTHREGEARRGMMSSSRERLKASTELGSRHPIALHSAACSPVGQLGNELVRVGRRGRRNHLLPRHACAAGRPGPVSISVVPALLPTRTGPVAGHAHAVQQRQTCTAQQAGAPHPAGCWRCSRRWRC